MDCKPFAANCLNRASSGQSILEKRCPFADETFVALMVRALVTSNFSCISANLAAFSCGITFGWTSPVIPKLNGNVDPENNPLATPISGDLESWIGSLLPVGAAFGPFAAGMYADKIGRKKTLLVAILPMIVAFVLAAYTHDANMFCLMRFLCGLAVGGIFTVLPMYIGEIAEDAVRGSLGSFMQLFITFGLLLSYSIGPYMTVMAFNLACLVVPGIFVVSKP